MWSEDGRQEDATPSENKGQCDYSDGLTAPWALLEIYCKMQNFTILCQLQYFKNVFCIESANDKNQDLQKSELKDEQSIQRYSHNTKDILLKGFQMIFVHLRAHLCSFSSPITYAIGGFAANFSTTYQLMIHLPERMLCRTGSRACGRCTIDTITLHCTAFH